MSQITQHSGSTAAANGSVAYVSIGTFNVQVGVTVGYDVTQYASGSWVKAGISIRDRIVSDEKINRRREALSRARSRLSHVISHEGETLTSLRLSKGLSQAQLAELIDSKQPFIARIEKNRSDLRSSTISKIADALGVSDDKLKECLELGWKLSEKEVD